MLAEVLAATLMLAQAPVGVAFSDLCNEPESGDSGGRYVRLHATAAGLQVEYGLTDGSLDPPVFSRQVRFDPLTGRLTFKVRTWEVLSFEGRIRGGVLSGLIVHDGVDSEAVRLARIKSIRQPFPTCLALP